MNDIILKLVGNLVISFITLFGIYLFMNGTSSPGGAFQAGSIFAVAYIIYCIINNPEFLPRFLKKTLLQTFAIFGVVIYSLMGTLPILFGGTYFEYLAYLRSQPHIAHEIGIFGIEVGVALTVFSVISYIFLLITGREE